MIVKRINILIQQASETFDLIANAGAGVTDQNDSGSATLKHRLRGSKMAWACYGDSTNKGFPNASEAEAHKQIRIAFKDLAEVQGPFEKIKEPIEQWNATFCLSET